MTVSGITTATQITIGGDYLDVPNACALLIGGTIKCWGLNSMGELADGTTTSSPIPLTIPGITTATSVSAGAYFTCARLSNGTIKCWGNTAAGIGDGVSLQAPSPVIVSSITTATQLSLSKLNDTACALLSSGTVQCWGADTYSAFGGDALAPVTLTGIPTNGIQISGEGQANLCVTLSTGTVSCDGSYANTNAASSIPSSIESILFR